MSILSFSSSLAFSPTINSIATSSSDSSLIFSTFFGGSNNDRGHSIAVDSQGNSYIIGSTLSSNFPAKNANNYPFNGYAHVFIAKFNSTDNLVFSKVLGGNKSDEGYGIAVDSQENIFITGFTASRNFPTKNAFDTTLNGYSDAFVAKLNSTGDLIFSTLIGGIDEESGYGIAVDSQGNCYVTGYTSSSYFPTKNAYNATFGGAGQTDAFVAKLNSTGGLVFSTYFGGSNNDIALSIAVDSLGNSYITGSTMSSDFPTKNAFNATYAGNSDAFVAKFDSTGNLLFSTFLGGSKNDGGYGIAVDSLGYSYITGTTLSSNFPTKNASKSTFSGFGDVFVAKFDPSGNLVFCTFLSGNSTVIGNGNFSIGYGIAVDSLGNIYVTGYTMSSDFPIKNAFNSTFSGGSSDAFVTKLDFAGNILFSSFLGGNDSDTGFYIAADSQGNCYVTGQTSSSNFPVKNAFNSTFSGGYDDAFVAIFDLSIYSSSITSHISLPSQFSNTSLSSNTNHVIPTTQIPFIFPLLAIIFIAFSSIIRYRK